MIDLSLEGKRAVVTGASLGIGAAVVKMLADQGASVMFCARTKDSVEELSKYKTKLWNKSYSYFQLYPMHFQELTISAIILIETLIHRFQKIVQKKNVRLPCFNRMIKLGCFI